MILARRRVLAVPDGSAATPSRLDPYEAAYLNGGGSLVAATAFSSLVRGGSVANTARRGRGSALPAWPPSPSSGPGTGPWPCGSHPWPVSGSSGRSPGRPTGGPVGFLIALVAATVVVAVGLAVRAPRATELGRRTLERLRAAKPRPSVGASPAELGMATALSGAGVLWAADTETALAMRLPREHGAFGGGCGGGGCGG